MGTVRRKAANLAVRETDDATMRRRSPGRGGVANGKKGVVQIALINFPGLIGKCGWQIKSDI